MMLNLLKQLRHTARLIHPGYSLRSLCKQTKHCVRGLVWPAATAEWFRLLEHPALAGLVRRCPKMYRKLQRPYLTSRWHTAQRLDALRQHYEFILRHCSPARLREIHSPAGKLLARLPATDLGRHELRLMASRFDKEGELSVCLCGDEGLVLFTLTFSVVRFQAGRGEIMIGGLQGNPLANEKPLIIGLTRHWHGLRPKALLLFALQHLAAGWDIPRLRAVGDGTHVARHWRLRKHVASSYDEWWREAGGRLAADGIFDLPARFAPREMAALKANKRQMYRRRYHMLADLVAQIAVHLGFPPAAPALFPEREQVLAPLETSPSHTVH
jgi:uncharacterized protein VirK/YbjX